jgi:hypothetical protein
MINSNPYILHIDNYSKKNTPIIIEFDTFRYNEIINRIKHQDISDSKRDVVSAVYTLLYTAIQLNNEIKDLQINHLSYYILLADYIYSYCTEILYKQKEFKLLNAFVSNSKKIMIDLLNQENTDYFIEVILNNLS